MQIKSESLFLKLVTRVSLDVLIKEKHLRCSELIALKESANRRINRICKRYMASFTFTELERNRTLLIIGYILRLLYEIRTYNYKRYNFLGKNFLIFICIFKLRFRLFIRLLRAFKKIGLVYDCKKIESNNVIVVADFPSHSFSYVEDPSPSHSSFGEYLVRKFGKELCLVSLDEYIRNSKKNERHLDSTGNLDVLPRTIIKRKFSFDVLCKNFSRVTNNFSFRNLGSIFGCLRTINYIDSLRYKRLISDTGCKYFYVMPFSDFNYFTDEVFNGCAFVQYSENFIVPPFSLSAISDSFAGSSEEFLGQVNLSALGCGLKGVGYLSLYSKVYNGFLKYFFNLNLTQGLNRKKEMPLALGFESRLKLDSEKHSYLAIFDNPPETKDTQFSRSIAGDLCANEDFVEFFLTDILEIAREKGWKVLFKPKYSLSNYSDTRYSDFLGNLIKKYSNQLIFLDPYVRVSDVIERCDILINFPFTSTKKFGDCLSKKSYYYFPKKYYDFFESHLNGWGNNLISKSELRAILAKS